MENQKPNQAKPIREKLEFTGRAGEFFKIWIVNLLLTIITFGIYGAWAKVRTKRYFYGNTRLGNKAFDYLATPMMILKGRLIAIGLLIVYIMLSNFFPLFGGVFLILLGVIAPWIIWRSLKFNLRMSAYRNVRFWFNGGVGRMYWILGLTLLIPIVVTAIVGAGLFVSVGFHTQQGVQQNVGIMVGVFVLAAYLPFPYIQKLFAEYYLNHIRYGQGQFHARLSTWKYFVPYLIVIAVLIGMTILMGILFYLGMQNPQIMGMIFSMQSGQKPSPSDMSLIFGLFIVFYIVMILLGMWMKAIIRVKLRHHMLAKTSLDKTLRFTSTMKAGSLTLLYFTNLLILMFTLGLGMAWVHVRSARYDIDNTSVYSFGDLSQYINEQQAHQNALGEEIGEAFDVDMDVAL